MTLYKIKNWDRLFENNRTRELKTLQWVPLPNKQDGDGYTAIMAMKNGPAIFGAWVACVQIASRCDPRGTLLRDGGKPHDCDSLARMSRMPKTLIQEMLETLSSNDINWLISDGCQIPASSVAGGCGNLALECLEGNGMEGKGKKGMEGDCVDGKYHKDSRAALHWLNAKSGSNFRETHTNLSFISERLCEPGVDLAGITTMIDRQCLRWKGTPQAEYLRPETLFNKTKFDSYYAARNQPIPKEIQPRSKPSVAEQIGDEMVRAAQRL